MRRTTTQFIAACTLITWATAVFAQDGRSLASTVWHAADAWGFVGVVAMTAVVIWLARE